MDFETAKRVFSRRYTCEHIPSWVFTEAKAGRYCAPQYRTDQEWFENTTFPLFGDYCESSNPSWPLGMRWGLETWELFKAGRLETQTAQAGPLLMIADGWRLPPGFPLVATGFRDPVNGVTKGNTYIALYGTEADGFGPDYVTFFDDFGRPRSAHASRFSIYKGA